MAPPKGHPDWATASRTCRAHSKKTGLPCRCAVSPGDRVCRYHGARGGHKGKRGADHPSFTTGSNVGRHDLKAIREQVDAMARLAGIPAWGQTRARNGRKDS